MKTRFVPTKVHGALDYATGPTLAFAPELFRMKDGRSASLPPRIAGLATAAFTPLSDHELAAKRVVPMKAHLALDAVNGIALALAPWIGGSAKNGARHWLPHAVVGALEVALAVTTKTEPADRRRVPKALNTRSVALAGAAGAVAAAAYLGLSRARD